MIETNHPPSTCINDMMFSSQAELLRTVKRFERLKTDLLSTLRSKEWRLDSESKVPKLVEMKALVESKSCYVRGHNGLKNCYNYMF